MNSHQQTGRLGERAAQRHLQALGYSILAVNVRIGRGEIDIVAEDNDEIVFVEVRTRRSHRMGTPEESITLGKQQNLLAAAYHYLQETCEQNRDWRIDIVAVELDHLGRVGRLSVIKSALEE